MTSMNKKILIISITSACVFILLILLSLYFFWYRPTERQREWERAQYEQLISNNEEQLRIEREEQAEKERVTREQEAEDARLQDEYNRTLRGSMESKGYFYMGEVNSVYESSNVDNYKTGEEKRNLKFEIYTISSGSSSRWVAVTDDGSYPIKDRQTYPISRGTYSTRDTWDDGPRLTFNAKIKIDDYIFYFNL